MRRIVVVCVATSLLLPAVALAKRPRMGAVSGTSGTEVNVRIFLRDRVTWKNERGLNRLVRRVTPHRVSFLVGGRRYHLRGLGSGIPAFWSFFFAASTRARLGGKLALLSFRNAYGTYRIRVRITKPR